MRGNCSKGSGPQQLWVQGAAKCTHQPKNLAGRLHDNMTTTSSLVAVTGCMLSKPTDELRHRQQLQASAHTSPITLLPYSWHTPLRKTSPTAIQHTQLLPTHQTCQHTWQHKPVCTTFGHTTPRFTCVHLCAPTVRQQPAKQRSVMYNRRVALQPPQHQLLPTVRNSC